MYFSDRQVSIERAIGESTEIGGLSVFEASALNGSNVDDIFRHLVQRILREVKVYARESGKWRHIFRMAKILS